MIHRFEHFHPLVVFFYYVGAITLIMLLQHPTILGVALFIIVLINAVQDQCKSLRKWLLLILISGLFILILNPLFNERGLYVLFEILGHRVTLEAVLYGGMTAFSIMAIISLFVSYNEVMTPNKLLFLFSKFLPQFAVLLMLTLRFIPLMKRRLDDISAVQQSKGIFVVEGKWGERLKNGLLYVQVLLTYSLEEAIQTADSMKAREYGQKDRSTYDHFRFKKVDWLAITYLISFLVVCIIGRFQGYLHLTIYPVMESIKLSSMESSYFAGFILYLAFPVIVEVGGFVRWRLLK